MFIDFFVYLFNWWINDWIDGWINGWINGWIDGLNEMIVLSIVFFYLLLFSWFLVLFFSNIHLSFVLKLLFSEIKAPYDRYLIKRKWNERWMLKRILSIVLFNIDCVLYVCFILCQCLYWTIQWFLKTIVFFLFTYCFFRNAFFALY